MNRNILAAIVTVVLTVVGLWWILPDLPDARSTCEHYLSKSFDPQPPNAVEACTEVCAEGHVRACRLAGDAQLKAGAYDEARRLYTLKCEHAGEARCSAVAAVDTHIARLAWVEAREALDGRLAGCASDRARCERACDDGDVLFCNRLAVMYAQGRGVSADVERSQQYYERACALHDVARVCPVSYLARQERCRARVSPHCDPDEDGPCTPTTPSSCRTPYYASDMSPEVLYTACAGRRACAALAREQCLLAPERCVAACDAGDGARCRTVARMYQQGEGLVRNPAKARVAFEEACRLGDTASCGDDADAPRPAVLKPLPLP